MHFLIQLDAADSSCNSFSWLCLATHNLLVAGISEWVFLMIIHTVKLSCCNLIRENYLNVTLTWFPYKGSVRQIECPFYQNRRITNQPKAWWIVNLQKEASYSFGSYAGLSFNETGYKWGLLRHDRRIYFFYSLAYNLMNTLFLLVIRGYLLAFVHVHFCVFTKTFITPLIHIQGSICAWSKSVT